MTQVTLRLPEELISRLKAIASAKGKSLNGWATLVLAASADPEMAGDEAARLRERFDRAGLLVVSTPIHKVHRPQSSAFKKAAAAAGKGRPLAEYVTENRR